MGDPYKTLRIRRNASPATVRKAYRALAKLHHPDHEGEAERFREIQAAYELLADPDRRARFDATGDDSPSKPDNTSAQVANVLAPCLVGILQEIVKHGHKPDAVDVVDAMRQGLANGITRLKERRKELERGKASLATAADRFTFLGDGENLLAGIARNQIAQIDAGLRQVDEEIDRIGKAKEYLKDYGYQYVARAVGGGWASTASTGATWRMFTS